MAVIKQMMQPSNVMNISKIAKVFQETVQTDMSFQNILWFGQQAFAGGLSLENISFFTMPYQSAWAWSRTYHQNLDYVVPDAKALLEIVNTQLSPFSEVFTLSDLDIMYTNSDGSVGSTTGRVEDAKAALPPVKPAKPQEPVTQDPETQEPVDDPEGGTTDPGAEDPGRDPETGEGTDPGTEDPVQGSENADPGAEEPADHPDENNTEDPAASVEDVPVSEVPEEPLPELPEEGEALEPQTLLDMEPIEPPEAE